MINTGILRTTDNDSSTRNFKKGAVSEQKLPRSKAKALGDVQNTLHSRSTNFTNPNTNSAVKLPIKSSVHGKPANFFTVRNGYGKEVNATPKSTINSILATPNFEEEFETHNHKLCEDDLDTHLEDYFKQYKLSEKQIEIITKSVKTFVSPLSISFYEPCEDIEIPDVKICEENHFSICDIFNDIIPEVPPLQ